MYNHQTKQVRYILNIFLLMEPVLARKLVRYTEEKTKEQIKIEAQLMIKLCAKRHDNIVQVFTHGDVANFPYYYIDMELCDLDLSDYIASCQSKSEICCLRSKALSPVEKMSKTFDILSDVTRGVAFIHQHEMVHRDIKPRNGNCLSKRY